MSISKLGYKKNSPYKNRPFIEIPSNRITMKGVEVPIIGISNTGDVQIMQPGGEYQFGGQSVLEIPLTPMVNKNKMTKAKTGALIFGMYKWQKGGLIYQWNNPKVLIKGLPKTRSVHVNKLLNEYENMNLIVKQQGGLVDYLESLQPDDQDAFVTHLESLAPDEREEVIKYMCGGKKMQQGGTLTYPQSMSPNAEVEGEETVKLPNGELQKFEGPKHAEGGIKVNLPGGSMIFSEHRKAPDYIKERILGKSTKKQMSYADLSKKFPTEKWMKILEDKEADPFKQETAKLQLSKNQANLETIFFAQEAEKQKEAQKKNPDMFQDGGKISDLYPGSLEGANTSGFNLSNYSNRFKKTNKSDVFYDPETQMYFHRNDQGRYSPHYKRGYNPQYDYVNPTQNVQSTQSTSSGNNKDWNVLVNAVPGEFVIPQGETKPTGAFFDINPKPNLNPESSKVPLDIVIPNRTKPALKRSSSPVKSGTTPVVNGKPRPNFFNLADEDAPVLDNTLGPMDMSEKQKSDLYTSSNPTEDFSDSITQPTSKKNPWAFGIDSKLAGTVLDIGLALSDKLNIQNPTLHDRRKTPLFNRFVDFDDKEVLKMYSQAIQQVQNSNMPQQVKDAKISELLAKSQDYQSKIELSNLQRYEGKRERDLDKLQAYTDQNIETRVQDIETFRQKMARINELKDAFKAQRKSRIVNSIKDYTDYVDRINYANQLEATNYTKNPITGRISFKETGKKALDKDILSKYNIDQMPKFDLGDGATGYIIDGVLVTRDKEGRVSTTKIGDK